MTGRVIGILADDSSDLRAVSAVKDAVTAAGMLPLVVAPHGGFLGTGAKAIGVQRTMLTCRSTEFDAIINAVAAPKAPATGKGPVKAPPAPLPFAVDPRTPFLLAEAFRHAKALGGIAGSEAAFTAAGIDVAAPGVVIGNPAAIVDGIAALLATHRVWERFPATV